MGVLLLRRHRGSPGGPESRESACRVARQGAVREDLRQLPGCRPLGPLHGSLRAVAVLHSRHRALSAREADPGARPRDGVGRKKNHQARLERESARRIAEGEGGDQESARRDRALPRRQRLRAEGGARAPLRRSGGMHRRRQRLERPPGDGGGSVSRARARRGVLAARIRRLPARDAGARRKKHRRAGEELRARPAGDACRDHAGDARGVHRQPEQSHRDLRPGRGARGFLSRTPRSVAVVVDEAYTEYLPPELRYDSVAWLKKYPNFVLTRTFSKVYGLAGLRVGFGLMHPHVADLFNRVRQPFNVNSLALAAALAALGDRKFVAKSHKMNRAGLARLERAFKQLGLEYIPSCANFVSFCVPRRNGEPRADRVYEQLLRQGVIVRPVAGYGMPDHLRVTVGTPKENEKFLKALDTALEA